MAQSAAFVSVCAPSSLGGAPEREPFVVIHQPQPPLDLARALNQRSGGARQRQERAAVERLEEIVVDGADFGTELIQRCFALVCYREQDAATILRIWILGHEPKAGEPAGLGGNEGAGDMQRLGDRPDA